MWRPLSWIRYAWAAKNAHGIHSPFVYQLYQEVIKSDIPDLQEPARKWEKECRLNQSRITFSDFGMHQGKSRTAMVSNIARKTETSGKYGALLHRLAAAFQPEFLLELGTCLGIGTLHTLTGLEKKPALMMTMEGGEALADLAEIGIAKHFPNWPIHLIRGNIDETLPNVVRDMPVIDWAYFDANHYLKPTLAYTDLCMSKVRNGSLFILDDIHWSDEMEYAWNTLVADSRCTITIDLFRMGLIFFREEQQKEHFVLRF